MTGLLPQTPKIQEAEDRVLRRAEVLRAVVMVTEAHAQAIPGALALAELRAGEAVREWLQLTVRELPDGEALAIKGGR